MKLTEAHKDEISIRIDEIIETEDWIQAKEYLLGELKQYPDDHWILTQLGEICYEMYDYKGAFEHTEKAFNLEPDCPVAANNYAVILYMQERDKEAINVWTKLLERGVDEVSKNECSEGMRFAKSLINDVRFRLGDAYLAYGDRAKAREYYTDHMNNRQKGIFSNFTKDEVQKAIKQLDVIE